MRKHSSVEKEILKSDKAWFDEFTASHYPECANSRKSDRSAKRRIALWSSAGSGVAAALLVLVLCLTNVIPIMPARPKPKIYAVENEKAIVCTLSDINNALIEVNIGIDIGFNVKPYRQYDTKSGDTLYYKLDAKNEDTFETARIYFYNNSDYTRTIKLSDWTEQTEINSFAVKYRHLSSEDDGLINNKYMAETVLDKVRIYIEYEQTVLEGNGAFFEFFEQTFSRN